ncbi:hypothetical protein Ddc_05089 [Ditylenchus destructor]|nr:hypothetical protein Ddc_05089 [Ditylenchus destructor]
MDFESNSGDIRFIDELESKENCDSESFLVHDNIQIGSEEWTLSDDSREYINLFEWKLRSLADFSYRFAFAVFLSAQMFDFLFNPVWMHGYIWALNLKLDVDLSDKSAGVILDHQLSVVTYSERLFHAIISTIAVIVVLRLCGYHKENKSVWQLLKLSLACGTASGVARCVQMKHRLYPAIHESFYIYLHFFVIGYCMSCRFFERYPKMSAEKKSVPGDLIKKNN